VLKEILKWVAGGLLGVGLLAIGGLPDFLSASVPPVVDGGVAMIVVALIKRLADFIVGKLGPKVPA